MAYNLKIADRVRECLADLPNIEEKEMMGGIAFMYNSKMCVGVMKDELMCRIDPAQCEQVLEMPGCRPMDFTGKPMRGWILVDETAITTKKKLEYWIGMALDFNKKAKKIQKEISHYVRRRTFFQERRELNHFLHLLFTFTLILCPCKIQRYDRQTKNAKCFLSAYRRIP